MIIQCVSCGKRETIKHTGTAEEMKEDINRVINDGWRYVKYFAGYHCGECGKGSPYVKFVGMMKAQTKLESHVRLMRDATMVHRQ